MCGENSQERGGKTFAPCVATVRILEREEKSFSRAWQVGQLFPYA